MADEGDIENKTEAVAVACCLRKFLWFLVALALLRTHTHRQSTHGDELQKGASLFLVSSRQYWCSSSRESAFGVSGVLLERQASSQPARPRTRNDDRGSGGGRRAKAAAPAAAEEEKKTVIVRVSESQSHSWCFRQRETVADGQTATHP